MISTATIAMQADRILPFMEISSFDIANENRHPARPCTGRHPWTDSRPGSMWAAERELAFHLNSDRPAGFRYSE